MVVDLLPHWPTQLSALTVKTCPESKLNSWIYGGSLMMHVGTTMKDKPPIEAEVVPPPQPQTMALQTTNPLDLAPATFKEGLARRKENRTALMDWVRSAMVEGIDFGRIHVVSKDKCRLGRNCNIPGHWSKPVLFKPGAEKICGMLGVTPTFPTLKDYEDAAVKGVKIDNIILRCEIVNASGMVIAQGTGARQVSKDYGDLNKSLKMAEKSGHIDATLRMAGLSEVFTQDLEDMTGNGQGEAGNDPQPGSPDQPTKAAPASGQPPLPADKKPLQPTEEGKKKLIAMLSKHGAQAKDYLVKAGMLLDTEDIEDLKLDYVPATGKQGAQFMAALQKFIDSGPAEKPAYCFTTDPGKAKKNEPWRYFPVPFGNHAGKKLEDLPKNVLFGFWANFKVEVEYKGRPKKAETIARDSQFRLMLDEAGKHYEFKNPDVPEDPDAKGNLPEHDDHADQDVPF